MSPYSASYSATTAGHKYHYYDAVRGVLRWGCTSSRIQLTHSLQAPGFNP
jgi:hypothetical protein